MMPGGQVSMKATWVFFPERRTCPQAYEMIQQLVSSGQAAHAFASLTFSKRGRHLEAAPVYKRPSTELRDNTNTKQTVKDRRTSQVRNACETATKAQGQADVREGKGQSSDRAGRRTRRVATCGAASRRTWGRLGERALGSTRRRSELQGTDPNGFRRYSGCDDENVKT